MGSHLADENWFLANEKKRSISPSPPTPVKLQVCPQVPRYKKKRMRVSNHVAMVKRGRNPPGVIAAAANISEIQVKILQRSGSTSGEQVKIWRLKKGCEVN
ncbi:hypothetical protein RUM43_011164 [Polyplax serrata]|uniref:Uncharacterized protein n=1 Tax=Polyplax serrata TaxID=468196 RepID=A0AAN8S7R2_POLSC